MARRRRLPPPTLPREGHAHDIVPPRQAVGWPACHWIGALDPHLRRFDIILPPPTAPANAYRCAAAKRGGHRHGQEAFADDFFRRLESSPVTTKSTTIVLNHLEPDHSGACRNYCAARPMPACICPPRANDAQALLKPSSDRRPPDYTRDHWRSIDLGGRHAGIFHTPYLHWPDTQCTWLVEEGMLFSGDVFGCHFCDARLFNDRGRRLSLLFSNTTTPIMHAPSAPMCWTRWSSGAARTAAAPAHGRFCSPPARLLRATATMLPPLSRLCAGHLPPAKNPGGVLSLPPTGNPADGRSHRHWRRAHCRRARVAFDLEGGDTAHFVDLIEKPPTVWPSAARR